MPDLGRLKGALCMFLTASGVLAAACSIGPPRSAAEVRADAAVRDQVYAALNRDPVFFFGHVDVIVDGGVVRLRGLVWTPDALYRAEEIARGVPGVKAVVNGMELEREGPR
jgi:hyperosmotically inducible periplasmic protein